MTEWQSMCDELADEDLVPKSSLGMMQHSPRAYAGNGQTPGLSTGDAG
jgi:hypothetical protein